MPQEGQELRASPRAGEQALSPRQRAHLEGVWRQLAHGQVFLVMDGDEHLLERPAEDDPVQEATLRVFTDELEAIGYSADYQEEHGPGNGVQVISCSLERLFQIRKQVEDYYNIPIRAEICLQHEGEWIAVDFLWTSFPDPN